jgi:hypothetical protein
LGEVVSQIELIRYGAGWKRNWRGVVRANDAADRYLSVVAMKSGWTAVARRASGQTKLKNIARVPRSKGARIPATAGCSATGLIQRIKEVRS